MRLLALDASGACWSAALLEGDHCIAERSGGDSRTATAAMPGLVQDLLGDGPISAVAVTTGPGSFTGLRGALALAHGLALGGGYPVIGVTVAEALRYGGVGEWRGPVWVALDARRPGRVFLDRGERMEALTLDALPFPSEPVLILGDAAEAVAAALRQAGAEAIAGGLQAVSAADAGRVAFRRLAGELPPCDPQPLYVEPPAARPLAP